MRRLFSSLPLQPIIEMLGAPLCAGQPHSGVALGPQALRAVGLEAQLARLGYRVTDRGDVCSAAYPETLTTAAGGIRHSQFLAQQSQRIAAATEGALLQGNFSLLLGGDHSVGLGSIAGVLRAQPDTRVLWVDAHADINTPAISPSGNLHGMPVAFLARQVPLGALGQEWAWLADVPPLLPARIAYIGLRDVDPQERGQLRALGIAAYTMADVDELGIAAVVKGALRHLGVGASARGSGSPPLHLSFDIDACDPSIAPSTGTTVPGGLTYREAHYLCEAVAHSGALQSMDMVEVNPQLCGEGQGSRAHTTASTAAGLCASAWGKTVLGVEGAQRRARG